MPSGERDMQRIDRGVETIDEVSYPPEKPVERPPREEKRSVGPCGGEGLGQALEQYPQSTVESAQSRLFRLGCYRDREHEKVVDGIVGGDTKQALERYCRGRVGTDHADLVARLIGPPGARESVELGVVYSIDQGALDRLQEPRRVLKELDDLKGIQFSSEGFLAQLREVLNDGAGGTDTLLQSILRDAEVETDEWSGAKRYTLTEESLKKLSEAPEFASPPDALLEGLLRIQGREYLTEDLFKSGVRVAVTDGLISRFKDSADLDACPDDGSTCKDFDDSCARMYPDVDMPDRQRACQCGVRLVVGLWDLLATAARRKPEPRPDPVEALGGIDWTGRGCGCVRELAQRELSHRDSSLQDVLYGFYPFWTDIEHGGDGGGEREQPGPEPSQVVEDAPNPHEPVFDILSRVGYFAFAVDDQGRIAGIDGVAQTGARFFDVSRRHGTRVDMALYKHDWSDWNDLASDAKERFFETLRRGILAALQTPSDSPLAKAESYLTLGLVDRSTIWDGVTLYFPGYLEDNGERYFHRFIKRLREGIRDSGRDFYINVMLSFSEVGAGIYRYEYLGDLVSGNESDGQEDDVDLFIVLLEEPTTVTKKSLREAVERKFKGMHRRNMLRKIVPVISPLGHADDRREPYAQFRDDLVYFQDNFAGVGFWPLVMRDQPDYEIIHTAVVDVFEAEPRPQFCELACPYRVPLRIALGVLVLSWLILGVIALSCACNWRRYGVALVLPLFATLGVLGVLLVCDPFFSDLQFPVLAAILLIGGVAIAIYVVRRARRGQQP
jgi:hypothetical protein